MKKKYFIIITLLFLVLVPEITLAQFAVILNFDDGYSGVYQNAFPLLQQADLPAVIFITTQMVGTDRHLTLDQLKTLKSAGWEIGSHTINHPDLSTLTPAGLKHEIIDSKKFLLDNGLIDDQYASFSSPMTVWNREIDLVVGENYQVARAKRLIDFQNREYPEMLLKVVLKNTQLNHIKRWILEGKKYSVPLVLIFHEIAEGGNDYFYSPKRFQEILSLIDQYQVLTFQQLINK